MLKANDIAISMDGKGAWRDNVCGRALLAFDQVRRGLPTSLRERIDRQALHRPVHHDSTTSCDRTRRSTARRQARYTSKSRSGRRHNLGGHHTTRAVWLFKKPTPPLPRTGPDSRAGRERQTRYLGDLAEREAVELRRDLALEPRVIALSRMLARPAAIAAMPVRDRLAARTVHVGAAPWIVARGGLC